MINFSGSIFCCCTVFLIQRAEIMIKFMNTQKTLFLTHFGSLLPIAGQIRIFLENPLYSLFEKFQKKTNDKVLRKTDY